MANGDWTLEEELAYFKAQGKPPQESGEAWLAVFFDKLHPELVKYIIQTRLAHSGEIMIVEAEFDDQLDRAHKLGQSSGLGQAAGHLITLAQDAFRSGDDEKAKLLRAIHQDLNDKVQEVHPGTPKS